MKTISQIVRYILLSQLIVNNPLPILGQSRGIDWIHGLGGNHESLESVDNFFFSERQITSSNRESYTTNIGIHEMAVEVDNKTQGGGTRLGIGHSLGGAAVRQVSLWNSAYWHGVITMGSPLRGAQISTSASDGTNTAFVGSGRDKMMAGPNVGSAVSPPIWPGLGLEFSFIQPLATLYSNSIAEWANNRLMSKFGLSGQTAEDLKPGSNYQNTRAGQTSYVPKILIWGSENYPILWKVLGTYVIGDSETNGVNLASDIADLYNLMVNGEEFQSWVNFPFHGFHQWRKGKWEEGRNWMNTDSNTGWQQVIGATWVETINGTYWENTCSEEYYYTYCDTQPDPAQCRSYCILTYPTVYYIYHDKSSDGVVIDESQKNIGGAWQGYHKEAPGLNHGEFKNPGRLEPILNWVFDNGEGSGVFRIDRR